MLTIRPEHMNQFSQAAYLDFENRMVVHLGEFFPEKCEALGEAGVRDEIRYGVRRAKVHGFKSELDVCRYIDLMFALGSDFDADSKCAPLHSILDDRTKPDPVERMDCLYNKATQMLEETERSPIEGS